MPTTMGSLSAAPPKHKQRVTSATMSIGLTLELELLYNDVPAILLHKRGNGPWQYMVINRAFRADAVPRNCDICLSAILEGSQKVVFSATY